MSRNYLVDTHTVLWATGDPGKLSPTARSLLADTDNRIHVSDASEWEISIKLTVGKIELPEEFFERLPDLGFERLPLRAEHFARYRSLPLLHRDPFDRILVAQAQTEKLVLITCDPEIAKYEVTHCW